METKILKLSQIRFDEKLYPRTHTDYVTVARYIKALKSKSVFPPIAVAKLGWRYILVDGKHRLEAHKSVKETHIEAEILQGLTKEEIYKEAVKRNISHGRQFSTQEVTKIILTLKDFELSEKEISKIVLIPAREINPFIAKRMTRISETQELMPLKAPLSNLAGVDMNLKDIGKQDVFSSKSQTQILDSVIALLKNKWIDDRSDLVMRKLKSIYKLLTPYFVIEEVSKPKNKTKK